MVRGVYTVEQSQPPASATSQGETRVDVYDNPTFSQDDADRAGHPEVDPDTITHVQQRADLSPAELSALDKTRARFDSLPVEHGDRLKLAFLIGFPLTFFLVAVVVTSQYQ